MSQETVEEQSNQPMFVGADGEQLTGRNERARFMGSDVLCPKH
jgi:hypothetical protein